MSRLWDGGEREGVSGHTWSEGVKGVSGHPLFMIFLNKSGPLRGMVNWDRGKRMGPASKTNRQEISARQSAVSG